MFIQTTGTPTLLLRPALVTREGKRLNYLPTAEEGEKGGSWGERGRGGESERERERESESESESEGEVLFVFCFLFCVFFCVGVIRKNIEINHPYISNVRDTKGKAIFVYSTIYDGYDESS